MRVKVSHPRSMLLIAIVAGLLSGCAGSDKQPLSIVPAKPLAGNSRAVNDALQLQGRPYVFGGQSPESGFDCSGLVFYVYGRQGLRLPRDTQSLAQQLPEVRPEYRQPGDLLFFSLSGKAYSHVGIYVGDDLFVHAPSAKTGRVMTSSLSQPYWRERFVAVRRPSASKSLSMSDHLVCGFG